MKTLKDKSKMTLMDVASTLAVSYNHARVLAKQGKFGVLYKGERTEKRGPMPTVVERSLVIAYKKEWEKGMPPMLSVDMKADEEDDITSASRSSGTLGGYSVEQASMVFRALDAGKTLPYCVVEFGVHPEILKKIAASYQQLAGSLLLSTESMKVLNALDVTHNVDGNFPITTGADLTTFVKELADSYVEERKAKPCTSCRERAATICKACAAFDRQKKREQAAPPAPSSSPDVSDDDDTAINASQLPPGLVS